MTAEIPGNISPLLSKAQLIGHASPTMTLHPTIGLVPRALDGLRAEADSAARTHSYLSHDEYFARHAPLQADYDMLKTFLASANGVQLTRTSSQRDSLELQASVADLELLFGTTINLYSYGGRQFYANAANPRLPVALAPLVQRIAGLENATVLKPAFSLRPASASNRGNPPFAPADIQTGYNVSSLISGGLTGSGQTIGIVTLAPFSSSASNTASSASDVTLFRSTYGLPNPLSLTRMQCIGQTTTCDTGGEVETTLDVEWSSAMAPGAAIKTFEGADNGDAAFLAAITAAVGDINVSVISTSWGECEAWTPPSFRNQVDSLLAGALAMGKSKSFFAASGDSGAYDCPDSSSSPTVVDFPAVDYPASSPYVTAVGGTTLSLTSPGMGYAGETAWSCTGQSSCVGGNGGSGGGCSQDWTSSGGPAAEPMPAWQQGRISLCGSNRAVPDVAGNADPSTGYSICYSGSCSWVYGGTSVAAPVWAGIMADINQGRVAKGLSVEGFANPSLYAAGSGSNPPFHDITSGSNGQYSAGSGWDAVTGWGSP
ncbi:MAG TPA: S53 family peptidase, partial [Chloroflexota bacterium]|nr:S53 family peptidase [Chloroflexota bacterium]